MDEQVNLASAPALMGDGWVSIGSGITPAANTITIIMSLPFKKLDTWKHLFCFYGRQLMSEVFTAHLQYACDSEQVNDSSLTKCQKSLNYSTFATGSSQLKAQHWCYVNGSLTLHFDTSSGFAFA